MDHIIQGVQDKEGHRGKIGNSKKYTIGYSKKLPILEFFLNDVLKFWKFRLVQIEPKFAIFILSFLWRYLR